MKKKNVLPKPGNTTNPVTHLFKTCNRILNLDHGDVTAFHCKIVAMIHTGKFQDALKQGKNAFLIFINTRNSGRFAPFFLSF